MVVTLTRWLPGMRPGKLAEAASKLEGPIPVTNISASLSNVGSGNMKGIRFPVTGCRKSHMVRKILTAPS